MTHGFGDFDKCFRSTSQTDIKYSAIVEDLLSISILPLGRFLDPEDVATAAVFLGSDASSMITGANLVIDGGFSIK